MMGPKQDDILLDVDGERVWGMASIAKAIINKRPGSVSLLGVLLIANTSKTDYLKLLELQLLQKAILIKIKLYIICSNKYIYN